MLGCYVESRIHIQVHIFQKNRRFCKRWWWPQILQFCGDDQRIRSMHVQIWPRLTPYRSVVSAKLEDLRPPPSFTKSSMGLQSSSKQAGDFPHCNLQARLFFHFQKICCLVLWNTEKILKSRKGRTVVAWPFKKGISTHIAALAETRFFSERSLQETLAASAKPLPDKKMRSKCYILPLP